MSKKQHKIYLVKLSQCTLVDHKFKSKTTKYLPISSSLLGSKEYHNLTYSEQGFLIALIKQAHSLSKADIELDESIWKANGKHLERLLEKLQKNQLLNFVVSKEVSKLVSNNNIPFKEPDFNILLPKQDQKEFIQKLTTFVTAEMGSIDTGFIKHYWKRIYDAFLSYEGFYEFVEQIYEGKTFSSIEKTVSQKAYFKKALDAELSRREGKDGK